MLYYSTNPAIQTVYQILKQRKALYTKRTNEWKEINKKVSSNWDKILFHAYLLEGQTEGLGFKIVIHEADYWAPTRIWVVSEHTEFELHRTQDLKKINGFKVHNCLAISKRSWAFAKIMITALIHG